MREFRVNFTLKALQLIKTIKESEDLEFNISEEEMSLGDTQIVVTGEREEIKVLEEIFNMIYTLR